MSPKAATLATLVSFPSADARTGGEVVPFPSIKVAEPETVAPKPRSKVDPSRGVNYCPICRKVIPQLSRGRARKTHEQGCKRIQDGVARMEKILNVQEDPEFGEIYASMTPEAQNEFWYRIHALSTMLPRVKDANGKWMASPHSDRKYKSELRDENRNIVLRCIRANRAVTRQEIAASTELHHSTVAAALRFLLGAGSISLSDSTYRAVN
jgi:truncated hemoglobin YjbI